MSFAGPCAALELTAGYCISTFVPGLQLLMVSIFLFLFDENNIFDTLGDLKKCVYFISTTLADMKSIFFSNVYLVHFKNIM